MTPADDLKARIMEVIADHPGDVDGPGIVAILMELALVLLVMTYPREKGRRYWIGAYDAAWSRRGRA